MHPVIWRNLEASKLRFQFTCTVLNTWLMSTFPHHYVHRQGDWERGKKSFQLTKRWSLVLSPKFRFFSMNRNLLKWGGRTTFSNRVWRSVFVNLRKILSIPCIESLQTQLQKNSWYIYVVHVLTPHSGSM